MNTGRDRRADKARLFRRIVKGRRWCLTCIRRARAKNQFSARRRGSC